MLFTTFGETVMLSVMLIIQELKNKCSNKLYGMLKLGFSLKISLRPLKEMLSFTGIGV
jgi:hypothetical protein